MAIITKLWHISRYENYHIIIRLAVNTEHYHDSNRQSPSLVYRLDNPDVVVLLFDNGRLIITGGERPEDADEAVDSILAELRDLNLL